MITKWYIPGIISLIGILPLFILKTQPLKDKFDQRVMNVFLPKDGDFNDSIFMFSEGWVLSEISEKQQVSFYLNDFTNFRVEVLENIRNASLEIKFGYDTAKVVKVVFGDNCNFNDLVSVMNICLLDEHKRWAWIQDSIFIFPPPAPSLELQSDFLSCGYMFINLDPPAQEWYVAALTVIKENWLLFLGYLALLIFSYRALIDKIKYHFKPR
jgi:hypothetical protein